jgi:hypothetical protein
MIRSIKKSTTFKSYVLLLDEIDHITPITGLLKTQITTYYSKDTGASTALAQSDFNWTELDSTNMPGLYAFEIINTSVTNTLGELVLVWKGVKASPPTVTDRARTGFLIVPITADYALGNGIRAVTLTTTGINDVMLDIYDSGNTELQTKGNSGTTQSVIFYLNDGIYKVRAIKAGYVFSLATLTVTGDMTQNISGTAIDNIDPSTPTGVLIPPSGIPEKPVIHP